MTHLPDSDLRELEGLVEKAKITRLQADWVAAWPESGIEEGWRIHDMPATPNQHGVWIADFLCGGLNAALIVAAVNALPSLIADLREARERNAWRAIESAPKDGTWIIGYWRSSDVMETVFYSSADTWESVLDNTDAQFVSPPTHWFPLPDAPARNKELEGKT